MNRSPLNPTRSDAMPVILALFCLPVLLPLEASASGVSPAPWEKERKLSDFQSLFQRSPFSLPTAEETSPLTERFALTGIVNIGGEEQVFIFDRTDQSRTLITHTPNTNNVALVSLLRDGDNPPQKATIRVGEETGTIGYLESAKQNAVQPASQPAPGSPAAGSSAGGPIIRFPQLPPLPQIPRTSGIAAPAQLETTPPASLRSIRRPVVMPPQSTAP